MIQVQKHAQPGITDNMVKKTDFTHYLGLLNAKVCVKMSIYNFP